MKFTYVKIVETAKIVIKQLLYVDSVICAILVLKVIHGVMNVKILDVNISQRCHGANVAEKSVKTAVNILYVVLVINVLIAVIMKVVANLNVILIFILVNSA
jgi:hypothetical protein